MNILYRYNDNTLFLLGFEKLNTDDMIKIYDGLSEMISISSITDIRKRRIGKIYLDITSPECKDTILQYMDSRGKNIIHFCEIDGIYYATDIHIDTLEDALYYCALERVPDDLRVQVI